MRSDHKYPPLETDRVYLVPLTQEHAEEVYKHFSDPEITEFMDIEPCKDIEEAKEIVKFHEKDLGCRWGLFHKNTDKFIGTCGYHCLELGEIRKAEIGFDLVKQEWGKGLMRETVLVLLEYGFVEMSLDYIEATVEQANKRSQALLERLGFHKSEELRDHLYYYTITKNDVTQFIRAQIPM
ncbi:GNAT family N-acetyltransferase [Paenibacillus turpanensis]|uniref:GNAT family N-acetyltransferase n=1 Tax=Paenibacillus turpanensis TaxID=2689078 RepID=UPI001FB58CAB|nr:GNAT family N-acetyltransferase [Paenibacillus turpanensis]